MTTKQTRFVRVDELSHAGEPGRYIQNGSLGNAVLVDEARYLRSRADDAHVTFEDVPELRELVDLESPEHSPDTADPGISYGCYLRTNRWTRHGAQLVEAKRTASSTNASLAVNDRPGTRRPYRNGAQCDRKGGDRKSERTRTTVKDSSNHPTVILRCI